MMTTQNARDAHARDDMYEHGGARTERTPYDEVRTERLYWEMSGQARKSAELDERVMKAVDALPSVQRTRAPRAVLSRRAFVLAGAGAAVVAGIGLLGIGLPLVRDGGPGAPDGLVGIGASSTWDNVPSTLGGVPFGLAVANAVEVEAGTKTFDLEPSERGLVPVSASSPNMFTLVMNLSVTGQDVRRVTCSTDGDQQAKWQFGSEIYYTPAIRFALVAADEEALDNTDPGLGGPRNPNMSWFDWLPNQEPITAENVGNQKLADALLETEAQGYDVRYPTLSLSYDVDEGGTIDWPGAFDPCVALVVSMPSGTGAWDDEVLQAYEAFQLALQKRSEVATSGDTQAMADTQQDLNDAQTTLMERIFAVCENSDTHLAWLRGCYVEVLTKAADIIGRTTLVVSAELGDGSTVERRYRILPVEGFEARVSERLDGLLELGDVDVDNELAYMKALTQATLMSHFPLFDLIEGVPIDDGGDPRLQAPLFTITDISADTNILVADRPLGGVSVPSSEEHER